MGWFIFGLVILYVIAREWERGKIRRNLRDLDEIMKRRDD